MKNPPFRNVRLSDLFQHRKEKGTVGLPVLSVTINHGMIRRDELTRKMESTLEPHEHLSVKKGDIAYNMMRMWQGASGLAKEDGIISPAYVVCSPKEEVCTEYFFHLFRTPLLLKHFQNYAYGITGDRLRLYFKDFEKISIDIPPLEERKKIAELLGTWDRAIELTEKLLAEKQECCKGLMQGLLSGKRRLQGFGKKWKNLKSEDVFQAISQKNGNGEIVLSVTQNGGIVARDSLERKINMDYANTDTYKLVEPGDFVISLRSFQGGLEYSKYRGLVSPAYHVIRPKVKISDDFYRHYFKSPRFIQYLAVATIGIRDGKQISYKDFSFMHIPYPPVEEQTAIAQTLNLADKEIALIKTKIAALREQKNGLTQQLLTGKIRVKT